MTGYELVHLFYSTNLNYVNKNSNEKHTYLLVLFLLGLIETAYITDPHNTSIDISEFLNAN